MGDGARARGGAADGGCAEQLEYYDECLGVVDALAERVGEAVAADPQSVLLLPQDGPGVSLAGKGRATELLAPKGVYTVAFTRECARNRSRSDRRLTPRAIGAAEAGEGGGDGAAEEAAEPVVLSATLPAAPGSAEE